MKQHFVNRFFACIAVGIFAGGLWGCGNTARQAEDVSVSQQEDMTVSRQEDAAGNFSVADYQEKMIEDRTPISECRDRYENETEEVKKAEYRNLDFGDCDFAAFPAVEQIEVLVEEEHGISAQESWDTLENWLESIGKQDEVDMETEARIVTQQFEIGLPQSHWL